MTCDETSEPRSFSVFLSVIIQGSYTDDGLHAQGYRDALREVITAAHPEADVICPVELNPDSSEYDEAVSRAAFIEEIELAASSDVTVAYAPVATMGTAVEMYRAYAAGASVFTISPMARNWAVRFLSTRVFADLSEFEIFVRDGGLGHAVLKQQSKERG